MTDLDPGFGQRVRAWRIQHGVRQEELLALMQQHAGYAPSWKGALSRIEHGKAWPTPDLVNAMALVDFHYAQGGGRGRSYWGWGEIRDSTLAKHPAAPLILADGEPEQWEEPEPAPAKARPKAKRGSR